MYIDLYANYGILAHEKETIFTVGNPSGAAVCYDKYSAEIPQALNPYVTASGSIAIQPKDATPYLLREALLTTAGGAPALRWWDKAEKRHCVTLKISRVC